MRFQAERAHRCYDEALALLPEADRAAQKPGLMMANIYRTLLREIEADGFQVLHQRTSLTSLRKLWIADDARTGAAADASRPRRSRSSAPAGPAWPPRCRPRRPATRSRCSRWRRTPGGRARSVRQDESLALDNGQHILIGAYVETLRLDASGRRASRRGCCTVRRR